MTVYYLTKRNILIFLRDRSAVFFSLLSMLIVLMLMAVFLGSMNVDEALGLLEKMGRQIQETDRKQAEYLVRMWTVAGILVVNSVTVSMVILGTMVTDGARNRLASFYVAPVGRLEIALGYILASVITGFFMCFATLVMAEGYIALTGGALLSTEIIFKALGFILLNCCVFSAMIYLAALFVKSSSAWSGLSTIVGTLAGFVGAIYLPMGMLPQTVARVLKCLPVLHGTALMRELFTNQAVEDLFAGMDSQVAAGYREAMGIVVVANEKPIPEAWSIAFMAAFGAAALLVAVLWMWRRKPTDR